MFSSRDWMAVWRTWGWRIPLLALGLGVALGWWVLRGWAAPLGQGPHKGPYPATTDACATCHRTHTATRPNLLIRGGGGGGRVGMALRLASPAQHPADDMDAFCLTCHNGTGASTTQAISTHGNLHAPQVEIPFQKSEEEQTARTSFRLGCLACHDPHGSGNAQDIRTEIAFSTGPGGEVKHLGPILFQGPTGQHSFDDGQSPSNTRLCVACHQAVGTLAHPGGADHVGHFDFSGENCLTCHPHSIDGRAETVDGFATAPDALERLIRRARVDLDLQVHVQSPVVAGQPFTYTVAVHNRGPQDAWQVRLVGLWPQGVSVEMAADEMDRCSLADDGTMSCTWKVLAVEATHMLTFTVRLDPAYTGEFRPQWQVSALQSDPVPENNRWAETVAWTRWADLAVAQEAPTQVAAGEEAVYEVVISNRGPSDASEVIFEDRLPKGFVPLKASAALGKCGLDEDRLICRWSHLPADTQVRVAVYAQAGEAVPSGTTATNRVSVTAAETDPRPDDNEAAAVTRVVREADLGVAFEAAPPWAAPDEVLEYSLMVTNAGPLAEGPVRLQGRLTGGTLEEVTASSGGCEVTPQAWTCTWEALSPSVTVPLRLRVRAGSGTGLLQLEVAVAGNVADPQPGNNTHKWQTQVLDAADVRVEWAPFPQVIPGTEALVSGWVENAGPRQASEVVLSVVYPPEGRLQAVEVGQGGLCEAPQSGHLRCRWPALEPNARVPFALRFAVPPEVQGMWTWEAEVASALTDQEPTNNRAVGSVALTPQADLEVTIAASAPVVLPSETVVYTLTVRNRGPSTAQRVTLWDPLPADLIFVGLEEANEANQACEWQTPQADPDLEVSRLSCRWDTLAPGEQVTVSWRAQVTQAVAEIVNVAQVGAMTSDGRPDDNQAEAVIASLPSTVTPTPTPEEETPTPTDETLPPTPTPPSQTPTPSLEPPTSTPTLPPGTLPNSASPGDTATPGPPTSTPTPTLTPWGSLTPAFVEGTLTSTSTPTPTPTVTWTLTPSPEETPTPTPTPIAP